MDGLYFRVSSERQTTENQFQDLLQVAERMALIAIGTRSGRPYETVSMRSNGLPATAGPGSFIGFDLKSSPNFHTIAFMWSKRNRASEDQSSGRYSSR
jgi:hypothetical protein